MALIVPAQLPGVCQMLFRLRRQQFSPIGDFAMEKLIGGGNYVVERVLVNNASGTLAAVAGAIRDAASGAGNIMVTPLWANVTGSSTGANVGVSTATGAGIRSGGLWLNITTPSAAPQTADVYVVGYVL